LGLIFSKCCTYKYEPKKKKQQKIPANSQFDDSTKIQAEIEEKASRTVAERMKEEEASYELISECEKGKSKRPEESEFGCLTYYRHTWGCLPDVGCMSWFSQNKRVSV
jgi:hypothetical protein